MLRVFSRPFLIYLSGILITDIFRRTFWCRRRLFYMLDDVVVIFFLVLDDQIDSSSFDAGSICSYITISQRGVNALLQIIATVFMVTTDVVCLEEISFFPDGNR